MIRARDLFKVPALSAFVLLIPYLGLVIYALIVICWANDRWPDIVAYFRGYDHRQDEISDVEKFLGI